MFDTNICTTVQPQQFSTEPESFVLNFLFGRVLLDQEPFQSKIRHCKSQVQALYISAGGGGDNPVAMGSIAALIKYLQVRLP